MQELLEWMEYIEDTRQQTKVRHTLKDILVIVLFATLAYNGTFVANLKVTDKNEKWYGRAYVRYLDENNQEQTYYADNVIKY